MGREGADSEGVVQLLGYHGGRKDNLVVDLRSLRRGDQKPLEVLAALGLHPLVLDRVEDGKPRVSLIGLISASS